MKITILLSTAAFLTASLMAADSAKDEVIEAAKKLGDEANYSWKSTVVVPEGSQFKPGPTEGQIEKGGFTFFKSSFGDNTTKTVLKGEKGAVTNQEGEWQGLADVEKEEGFGRFRAMFARSFKAPAAQAEELANGTKSLKKEGDTYSGELTEDTAKNLLSFGRRGGANGPSVSNAKGSAKFWIKDGSLTKYEFKVQGTRNFNGNDQEIDRTTTVEIKEVGATKVAVPDEAKKKLS